MTYSLFQPPLPTKKYPYLIWGSLHGSAASLAIAEAIQKNDHFNLIVTPTLASAHQLHYELRFFINDLNRHPILRFPEWETLPYDSFSPHQDIISDRLLALAQLQHADRGILITSITTLMNRIAPPDYIQAHVFNLNKGDSVNIDTLRHTLETAAYRHVGQVTEHGEYAVRGSLVDIFPMGLEQPLRIELFDNEIETLRSFDPETQRSIERVDSIQLLPATEYPLTAESIQAFKQRWRAIFQGNPAGCSMYQDIGNGIPSPGIEYFIPLFFEKTASLFDYLPKSTLVFRMESIVSQAEQHWQEITKRHEQLGHDIQRPILTPTQAFFPVNEVFQRLNQCDQIEVQTNTLSEAPDHVVFASSPLPNLNANHKLKNPLIALEDYLTHQKNRILFCAETTGRREILLNLLKQHLHLTPTPIDHWGAFVKNTDNYCITTYPLENGLCSTLEPLTIITESQLMGERLLQRRRRKSTSEQSPDVLIKNLAELRLGDPIVHNDHGVGRYRGLEVITLDSQPDEYLHIEYSAGNKLYVPVASLHLISRYTGTDNEHAPLHSLGNDQWERAKRKASEKIRDVAAELLEIHAKRAAQEGYSYRIDDDYFRFSQAFPFEETPDQLHAIEQVIEDMQSKKPMDRLVCGDVGFGKTEVAMRATYVAASNNKQVVILAPTTLLAQQHYQNFKDRFADWPFNIEVLSRFRTAKEQQQIIENLETGKVDVVIGTHKLLMQKIPFKSLGLLIVDEEHRFGVKHKEQIKSLRANVDILTLTATPIPRTLNMAFAGMRDLSIIATPPMKRLAVKTFIQKYNKAIIREAILREILRGGQVYFIHNKVETIEKIMREMADLVPEAQFNIGHGQMRERDLEQVMTDFYHRRFNVLVATTIIESGIDIPNANTILIDRADHFGLSQLHQLRGRVGRSHHQAYAYLLIPDKKIMTADAIKRLEAIEALKDLGIGFTLATHDLEIRGAGELLGEEQSGQMQEIGFTLYMEMLERAVNALKKGKPLDLLEPASPVEINTGFSTIIPDTYLPDVNSRLLLYKRIASATSAQALQEIQVEMVDRFGLFPPSIHNLFATTQLKLRAEPLGICKIEVHEKNGKLSFTRQTSIDPIAIVRLIQQHPEQFQLKGSHELRFNFSGSHQKPEERLTFIHELLDHLTS